MEKKHRSARKQKRDTSYYLKRLEKEHPTIHRDLLAGRFASPNQALILAGLKKPAAELKRLKQVWKRASNAERIEFLKYLRATSRAATTPTRPVAPPEIVDSEGRLTEVGKNAIWWEMGRRGLGVGKFNHEVLGFSRYDVSLGNALRGAPLWDPAKIAALRKWFATRSSP